MDGGFDSGFVGEGLAGEMIPLEIAPDGLDIVEFWAHFGSHWTPVRKRGEAGTAFLNGSVVEHEHDRFRMRARSGAGKLVEALRDDGDQLRRVYALRYIGA